jgi:pimeloyl-ACP methyl ester carboxylesterase
VPKVLFVPGLPGSELRFRRPDGSLQTVFPPRLSQILPGLDPEVKRRLKGPDDLDSDDGVSAGPPIRSAGRFLGFDLMKQAQSLYDILEGLGIGQRLQLDLGWDWRRPVTDDAGPGSAQRALESLLAAQPEPVTAIVHSTGGLLLRHFLEQHPALVPKVARVIAFGATWAGTLKSLAVLLGRQGFGPVKTRDAQEVFASAWAALDLLPRDRGSRLVQDPAGQEVDLLSRVDWTQVLPNDPQGALGSAIRSRAAHSLATLGKPAAEWTLPVDVVNVVGWGKKTLVGATLGAGGVIDLAPPDLDNEAGDDAEDSCADRREMIYQGDGTAPVSSAAWLRGPRVKTYFVPIGALAQVTLSNRRHSELWRNPGGQALLAHHLAGAPLTALAFAAVDWSDKLDPGAATVRIRYVMQSPDGAPLPGANPRVRTANGEVAGPLGADGRGLLELPRSAFPKTAGGRFRRVVARLPWQGDATPKEQAMFIEP